MMANKNDNTMDCADVLHLLPLYLGGELETDHHGDPVEGIRVHVEGCAPCAQELEQSVRLVRVRQEFWREQTSNSGEEVSLRTAVLAKIEAESREPVLTMPARKSASSGARGPQAGGDAGHWPRIGSWAPMAAAAALFLAAVGLGYQYWGGDGASLKAPDGAGTGAGSEVRMVNAPGTEGAGPSALALAGHAESEPIETPGEAASGGSGGLHLAGIEAPDANGSGLRRVDPGAKSLLEEARPWGLEETPAGMMEFGRGAMKMATHEDDF